MLEGQIIGIDIARDNDKTVYYGIQNMNTPRETYFVIAKNKKEFIFYKQYLKDKFGHKNKFIYLSRDNYMDGLNPETTKIIKCGEYWNNQIEKSSKGQFLLKMFEENKNVIEFQID